MDEAIKGFADQFRYEPVVENAHALRQVSSCVVSGMGGSHLAADLVKSWKPALDIVIHSDYGLPAMPETRLMASLFIASSYSGNTEEVIDGLQEAQGKGVACAVIATGGVLLNTAQETQIPYIQLPNAGIQPRSALGYSLRALLKLLGEEEALGQTAALAETLKPPSLEDRGRQLASVIRGHVPVIYSSVRNQGIAYNWKIKFNETGKIPAFCNVVPELNHNEMTGFDKNDQSAALSALFHVLMIADGEDEPRVAKRMEVLRHLYQDRQIPVEILQLGGLQRFERIFSSLVLADWTAYHTAILNNADPEEVPMVEEFKKLIATQ